MKNVIIAAVIGTVLYAGMLLLVLASLPPLW
jgi:hypothetical protein